MGKFAKLFDTEQHGQILALLHNDEGKPGIKIIFQHENLQLEVNLGYDTLEEAKQGLDEIDQPTVLILIDQLVNKIMTENTKPDA